MQWGQGVTALALFVGFVVVLLSGEQAMSRHRESDCSWPTLPFIATHLVVSSWGKTGHAVDVSCTGNVDPSQTCNRPV